MAIKARATAKGMTVTLSAGFTSSNGLETDKKLRLAFGDGVSVFVHPRGTKIRGMLKEQQEAYKVAWMAEVGITCEC